MQRLRDGDDRVLARAVRGRDGAPDHTGHRRRVHDVSRFATRVHRRHEGLDPMHDTPEVHVDHAVPLTQLELPQRIGHGSRDACVVAHDVDRAERRSRPVGQALHVVELRDVDRDRQALPGCRAEALRRARQRLFVAIREHHAHPALEELPREREPDAARGAGDDRRFPRREQAHSGHGVAGFTSRVTGAVHHTLGGRGRARCRPRRHRVHQPRERDDGDRSRAGAAAGRSMGPGFAVN